MTVIWGLIVLIVLVVVHELGHFIAARAFGVRVTEFMIGLPGPSVGFEFKGTRWGVTCIPLGGYNRITGMEGGPEDPNLQDVLAYVYRQGKADAEHVALGCSIDEDAAETALIILDGWGSINAPGRQNKTDYYLAPAADGYEMGQAREVADPKALLDAERRQTYRNLNWARRLAVLFAGPLMNVALAFVLMLVIFCGIGVSVATTQISGVADRGAAAAAGLQAGDTITAVGETSTPDWTSLSAAIEELEPGQEVEVSYQRDGADAVAELTVGTSETGEAQLGIYAGTTTKRLSPVEGLQMSWEYLQLTVESYAKLFNPVTTGEVVSQSTSVVGIAVMAEQAASTGVVQLLYLLAVISLSLGIVNLVPIPPLDGGKIVVETIQKVIGRDISVRTVNIISIIGIALFVLLFVVLLQQDISRFVFGNS